MLWPGKNNAIPRHLGAQAPVQGLYVHVPFCFHKCHYCDFYSITRQTPDRMERFVDLLLAEAAMWEARPGTVFFGGGTPTLLPLEPMRRLILGLRGQFDCSAVTEWTVEANPATVSAEYCAMLRECGVDRMSFGAQSFAKAELAMLERHHEPDDVARGIEIARGAGFERLNVDLIYAIPGQSMESWLHSLETALDLETRHISCYGLTYEPNTAMAVRKRLGHFQAVAEDTELAMMHATRQRLAREQLRPYEISNYAMAGQECRHNLMYWNGGNYIGLGPSAASHMQGTRWRNRPHLGEWEDAVAAGELAACDVESLGPLTRAGELVMLQLRLEQGVDFADFTARTGLDARAIWPAPLRRLSVLELICVDERGFRLAEAGLRVADSIAAEFLDSPPICAEPTTT
jgi:oxygen-independent coproporphyrinogen-3 oxidase